MDFQRKTLYLTVLLSLTATLVTAQSRVTLDISRSPVKVGEPVDFTCRIQELQADSVLSFNKVVVVEGEIRDVNKEPIATFTVVNAPYKTRGFQVIKTTEGSDTIYKLTIDAVQLDDGGSYSCSVARSDNNVYAAKLLEVYRVPESVKFTNYNESDVVEVNETSTIDGLLTCHVSHVMPHPDVTLTLGDRDVTNDFLKTARTNILCTNIGQSSKTCPLHSDYDMEAASRGLKLTYMDNGLRLTCSAKMRDFEQHVTSTSVLLDVKHAPKINCTSPLVVRVNQTAVAMRCTVFANPIDGSQRTWVINKGKDGEMKLSAPVQDDYYAVSERVDPNNPTRVELVLIIQQHFTNERFGYTYDVDATNSFGTQNAKIIVQTYSDAKGNGVTQLPSAFVSFSSTLLVLTSSILLSRRL